MQPTFSKAPSTLRADEIMDDTCSIVSGNSSLSLDEEDRRYLEALTDKDYVATKNTRHPLGLFSVIAFILQQVIGMYLAKMKNIC